MATLTAQDRYRSEFETLERRGVLGGPAWLASLRRSAIEQVGAAGFPTTRDEHWRYTNLAPLIATDFRVPAAGTSTDLPAERLAVPGAQWPRVVLVDGRYVASLSSPHGLPAGVRLSSLAESLTTADDGVAAHLGKHAGWDANVFAALNAAFFEDGVLVQVAADVSAPLIEVVMVATASDVRTHPRILVLAGPHSRVAILERYVGLTPHAYFTNAVTEIVAAPGAEVAHYAVQEEATSGFHVATVDADLDRDATFSTCAVTLGGRLSRTTLAARFRGPGARADLRGLYVLGGQQHVDTHVTVDHAVPRCTSRQLYKGVLDGASRAVFNGRILVRPDAQKTDASQTNKHLLLSDAVEVDSKPWLEIFADDVKCTHGAAEGQLAPEALFYLRTRGLGEAAARALLTYGFAREVVATIAAPPLQAYVDRALTTRLGAGRTTGKET